MSQNQSKNEQLTKFAQAVGKDIRLLQQGLNGIPQSIETAITSLKNELMGGDVDAALDTFKELAEKLNALENSDKIGETILAKFTEIRTALTALETGLNETANTDYTAIYNQAKGA